MGRWYKNNQWRLLLLSWSKILPWNWGQKVAYNLLPVGTVGWPQYPRPGYENNVKYGYAKNEVIYRCIIYKVRQMSQLDIDIVNEKGETLPNHPAKNLFTKPLPYFSMKEIMAMVYTDLDLCGKAYFEKVRSESGRTVQLWRLRPDYVRPVPDTKKFISHYEYEVSGQKVVLPYDDLIEFKLFDPLDQYQGQAPVSVAARVGDVDSASVDFLKELMQRGGVPLGFLKSKKPISVEQAKRIRNDWVTTYGGTSNWIKPAVLGGEADWQAMSFNLNEMAMEKVDAKTISRICMALGVNPILIGASHGLQQSSYNNYKTARESFWQDDLMPQLTWIMSVLNNRLVYPEYKGTGVKAQWNLSNVAALQVDKDKLWTRARDGLAGGALTVNEYRQEIGKPIVVGGDVFLRSAVTVEVGTSIINKKSLAPLEFKQASDHADPPDNGDRLARETATKEVMIKFFTKQKNKILKEVNKSDSDSIVVDYIKNHWPRHQDICLLDKKDAESIKSEEDYELLIDKEKQRQQKQRDKITQKAWKQIDDNLWENEEKELYTILYPSLLATTQVSVLNTIAALENLYSFSVPVDLANDEALKWLRQYSFGLVKGINNTTKTQISEAIAAWIETDLPRSALVDELAPLFGDIRAAAIGRTETTRAFFQGNKAVWKASKIVSGWTWKTSLDEAVCPICGPLHNTKHKLGASYAPPDPHPNCRCYAEAILKGE